MSSSRGANAPGVYSRPVETPHAPSASACATSARIRAISAAVAGRFALPTTMPRIVPSPTIDATLTDGCRRVSDDQRSVKRTKRRPSSSDEAPRPTAASRGAPDEPSCPTTIVVMPCRTSDSARGSSHSDPSPCEWISMKPGATARPFASISVVPRSADARASETILPFVIATSSCRDGPPRPSKTLPLRMMMSAVARERRISAGAPIMAAAAVVEARRKSRRFVMDELVQSVMRCGK